MGKATENDLCELKDEGFIDRETALEIQMTGNLYPPLTNNMKSAIREEFKKYFDGKCTFREVARRLYEDRNITTSEDVTYKYFGFLDEERDDE